MTQPASQFDLSDQLLKPEQAAVLIGVTVRTLQWWRTQGTGPPFVQLNRRVIRYPLKRLQEWEKSKEVASLTRKGV